MNGAAAARLIAVAAALAIAANSTCAQVAITQTGQLLDSNFLIGSGGYNNVAGGIGGVNSQLYVYGQASGLGNFHGPVGYYAPNQLNLNLPGAGVAIFRQQSVGVQDILGGNTYAPAPYYDRARTIWTMPGTVIPTAAPSTTGSLSPMSPAPLSPISGSDSTSLYRPLSAGPFTGSGVLPSFEGRVGLAPQLTPKTDEGSLSGAPSGQLPLTGFDPLARRQLLRALAEAPDRNPQEVDSQVKAEVKTDVGSPPRVPPLEEKTATKEEGTRQSDNIPDDQTQAPLAAERLRYITPPQPDQDVYLDVLVRMQQQRIQDKRLPVPERSEAEPGHPWVPAIRKPQPAQGLQPVPTSPTEQPTKTGAPGPTRNIVEYTPQTGIVLHGLAGQNADQFNLRMAAAEKDLKAGLYTQAAANYSAAAALDPDNPLARLGLGIVAFAKGEYLSSVIHIRRAIILFPPIARAQLDMPAMVDPAILELRMGTLDSRLLASRLTVLDQGLLFMAAYMHYNLGQIDQARQYAQKLLSTSDADKAFTDFAAFVMSEQAATHAAPSTQPLPSTQPAPTTQPTAP